MAVFKHARVAQWVPSQRRPLLGIRPSVGCRFDAPEWQSNSVKFCFYFPSSLLHPNSIFFFCAHFSFNLTNVVPTIILQEQSARYQSSAINSYYRSAPLTHVRRGLAVG